MSFRAVSVWEDVGEIPIYIKFFCSKCNISGLFKEIQN